MKYFDITNRDAHFTLAELTRSQTASRLGINNQPSSDQLYNLEILCTELLEPLRDYLGQEAIILSSGYRSLALNNQTAGSSKTSQHCTGQACDFHVTGYTTQQLFDKIVASSLKFDQLINEFNSWVHISYNKGNNRMQKAKMVLVNGKTGFILL